MSRSTLDRIQRLVLLRRVRLSEHALIALQAGEFDMDSVEYSILNAARITSQADEKSAAVDGKKHTVLGPDRAGLAFETVGKIMEGFEGEEYFIISAYEVK